MVTADSSLDARAARAARRWGLAVLASGMVLATCGSLTPFNFQPDGGASLRAWLTDFPMALSARTGRVDFFSNICLFIPIGLGGMAWLTRDERTSRAILSTAAVIIFAFVLSLMIEGAQTMLPSRVASWFDVAAQGIGVLIGISAWLALASPIQRWLIRLESARGGVQRFELLLQAYCAFQFCMAVFPLDVTVHPVDLYHKFQRGRINLIPFVGHHWSPDLIAEMLFFSFTSIPFGALAACVWRPTGAGLRNVPNSVALGLAMVVGIELCQLLLASRFTDATQVIFGGVGVLVGVLLTHAFWPHHSQDVRHPNRSWLHVPGTWLCLAALYAFIPAAFLLWPFEFVFDGPAIRNELENMLEIPFARLLRNSELSIHTILVRDVLLFLPLGLLLGAAVRCTIASLQPVLAVTSGMSIVVIAGAIEVLQTTVPQRQADLTSVFLSSASALVAMTVLIIRNQPLSDSHEQHDSRVTTRS